MSAPAQSAGSAIRFEGIGKRFPGVIALQGVDLDLRRGEIHALIGENGAGKSTLIKILAGVVSPDDGVIRVSGRVVSISSPKDAHRLGISLVPQDALMVPELSIGRNILLGLESATARRGALSRSEREMIEAAMTKVGAAFDVEAPAKSLGVPELRLAQIARALLQSTDIMVLDEPTAVLSEPDADHLLERLDRLRSEGRAILYVTHRLSEVMRLADRTTILRDGRQVGVFKRGEITRDEMVRLIAREVHAPKPRTSDDSSKDTETAIPKIPRLVVRGLSARHRFADVDMVADAGRIVGIAGVQGSGHGALLRAIGGLDPVDGGRIEVDGERLPNGSVRRAVQRGVLTVPADRRGAAIVPALSVRSNLAISNRIRARARRWGLRSHAAEREMTKSYINDLAIRPRSTEIPIASLSGGNQQKAALARVLEGSASVLLIEEPTQGVDVSARSEIHGLLKRVARGTGCTVVIATSEFEELIDLAEDIHIMRSGRLVKHLPGSTATYHKILESALP